MKGKRKLLYVALAGLLTVFFTGTAFGQLGPGGNGGGGEASNGTHNQAQNNQCCTGEAMEVLGVSLEYIGTQDQTRARDGSECGGVPGPNQNPDPGWGPPE
jgi:hypothetical protein